MAVMIVTNDRSRLNISCAVDWESARCWANLVG